MNNYEISRKIQSGFFSLHSTDTALDKVTNELLLVASAGLYSILILLDLSSAFWKSESQYHWHCITMLLINCLKNCDDISYSELVHLLSSRSFSFVRGDASSFRAPLLGLHRGLFLAPFYKLHKCIYWGKSCVDIIVISVATQMICNWMSRWSLVPPVCHLLFPALMDVQ